MGSVESVSKMRIFDEHLVRASEAAQTAATTILHEIRLPAGNLGGSQKFPTSSKETFVLMIPFTYTVVLSFVFLLTAEKQLSTFTIS